MKQRIILFAILAALWCGVIFFLSSENSAESSRRSGEVVTTICEVFVPNFETYPQEKQSEIVESMSFSVRKAAHFTAYAVLGAFLFQIFCFVKDKRSRSLLAIGSAFLYAASDEFHQSFSPGRSCEFRDMLIDTGGAALAVLLSLLVMYLINKRKKQKPA